MSEFDKEAEREKLREQFATERDDRASTERMSELLLQGATMTNRHCEVCGNPIFRVEDREFCPTCEDGQPAAETPEHPTGQAETEPAGGQPDVDHTEDGQSASTDGQPRQPAAPTEPPSPTPDRETDGLATARGSLERTVTTLARRAEASDELGRTREYLAAAREAAEALAAVKRASR